MQCNIDISFFHKSVCQLTGEDVVITCQVIGYPPPDIAWFKVREGWGHKKLKLLKKMAIPNY